MGRKLRIDAPGWIFHVTSRVNWRVWHLAGDAAKRLLERILREAAAQFSVRILAGVLMSNHLHLVTQSPPPGRYRELTGRRLPSRHFLPYPWGSAQARATWETGKFPTHLPAEPLFETAPQAFRAEVLRYQALRQLDDVAEDLRELLLGPGDVPAEELIEFLVERGLPPVRNPLRTPLM